MKICIACGEKKPSTSFNKRGVCADGLDPRCRECANKRHRAWASQNKNRISSYNSRRVYEPDREKKRWETRRYSNHGITKERYDELLTAQNGVCAICLSLPRKSFHIDHDHSCCSGNFGCEKCVRGLLCERCNRALGQLEDDPRLIRKAIEYLESSGR